ncbi:ExbD/TolR family protein [Roseibaca sp. Y0-43]|uniref:ExbD/TolR family protein n=1 Tax=Roseibaca sp. Y0-43 TaxID=2816854 RepID=UPI001D0C9E33|nr:biopolymer transporter ExbD [Roseibaca sp. Y0-43]MCC1480226.1 biopolymer transporter ExbD [Roseibaca sp. Y0-43]
MDFVPPSRPRTPRESVVPMINVVFLLLIFFLMSAQIAPPDPADVTPPSVVFSDGPVPAEGRVLWLAADGRLLEEGGGAPDMAVLGPQVSLRADGAAPAADLARVLRALAVAGVRDVTLVARQGGG